MRVLLTGASGFVGSHILDELVRRQIPVTVLLRPTADRRFISEQLAHVEIRAGSLTEAASLDAALAGVTHVIHCAGATKALDAAGFFSVNQSGTRHVVAAVNRHGDSIQRMVHISSLAAAGPATADRPKRESDEPSPVSDYGRSKLAAEQEVIGSCRCEWTILRPPAVYGPRDPEFLRLFKASRAHLLPRFGGGRQPLTLVYVGDLAAAVVTALLHPRAAREVYFTGAPEVVTAGELAATVANASGHATISLPLPNAVLWVACRWAGAMSRLTRRASVLSPQKYAELRAPGWVCDVSKLKCQLGFECRTPVDEGVRKTLDWYRTRGWVRA